MSSTVIDLETVRQQRLDETLDAEARKLGFLSADDPALAEPWLQAIDDAMLDKARQAGFESVDAYLAAGAP